MIADWETNMVYIADTLSIRFPAFAGRFKKALISHGVQWAELPDTKDVWAVDYMPLQLDKNSFIQFVYNPGYLNYEGWDKSITNTDALCAKLGIRPMKSSFKIDGGNMVHSKKKLIVTDKIFTENPGYSKTALLDRLYEMMRVEKIIVIPKQPYDDFGHSDSMIRFITEDAVLVNDFSGESKTFNDKLSRSLKGSGLQMEIMPYNLYHNKSNIDATGTYINFLQVKDMIFVPIFQMSDDINAIRKLEQVFSRNKIISVDSREIARDGGVLNCVTWNIFKSQN